MDSSDSNSRFFFDLPLADVYSSACTALRLIYHGSEEGVLTRNNKKTIDLGAVKAFQITLKHRSVTALSDRYDYSLIYYPRVFGEGFWTAKFRQGCPTLRKITRRVKFTGKPSLKPKRVRFFYIKSNRPVHVAKYGGAVPADNYVPLDYLEKFDERFSGFLMRSPKNFPLLANLFSAQGLAVGDLRKVSSGSKDSPEVRAYVSSNYATSCVPLVPRKSVEPSSSAPALPPWR